MQTGAAGDCRRPSLWDSYNVAHAPISKTYAADAIPAVRARCGNFPRVEARRVHARLSGFERSGAFHAGRRHAGPRSGLLRSVAGLRLRLRPALRRTIMIFDNVLAGLVSAGLLFYLTYALLRTERF